MNKEVMLLEKAKAGDEIAFKNLIKPHITNLLNIGYYILKSREDAWDILQDTLILVWKNIKKFDPSYPFYPYVKKIYTNECFKHLKKQKSKNTLSLDYEYEDAQNLQIEDISSNPEEVLSKEEFKSKVKEAMEELPDHYRIALWLRIGDGMSYKEIADTLNINIGTVKSRINMGRKMLISKLRDYIGGEKGETP